MPVHRRCRRARAGLGTVAGCFPCKYALVAKRQRCRASRIRLRWQQACDECRGSSQDCEVLVGSAKLERQLRTWHVAKRTQHDGCEALVALRLRWRVCCRRPSSMPLRRLRPEQCLLIGGGTLGSCAVCTCRIAPANQPLQCASFERPSDGILLCGCAADRHGGCSGRTARAAIRAAAA